MQSEGSERHSVGMEGWDLGRGGEAPYLGTSGFSTTTEDDRGILGKTVTLVAQFDNAHQVVMKVRHYVAALDGEFR